MNGAFLPNHWPTLDGTDYFVLSINIALILFARPLMAYLSAANTTEKRLSFRINLLRVLNLGIAITYSYQSFFEVARSSGRSFTLLTLLATLYLTYLTNYVLQYLINIHYGKTRDIGDKTLYVETYQSRLLSILITVLLTVVTIIAIINQLGFNDWLKAGGVVGVMGIFLGLTQASWAPDIISGLIILNSDMFEAGDIVETNDGLLGRIYKTKMFHTEIINIANNHRIMIRNAHMRDKVIHNLSKFATGHGLRECLRFKISYDTDKAAVHAMFDHACKRALEIAVPFEGNIAPEINVLATGDHAIEWGFFFHIKQVDQLLSVRRSLRELILEAAIDANISLATPTTARITGHLTPSN